MLAKAIEPQETSKRRQVEWSVTAGWWPTVLFTEDSALAGPWSWLSYLFDENIGDWEVFLGV